MTLVESNILEILEAISPVSPWSRCHHGTTKDDAMHLSTRRTTARTSLDTDEVRSIYGLGRYVSHYDDTCVFNLVLAEDQPARAQNVALLSCGARHRGIPISRGS